MKNKRKLKEKVKIRQLRCLALVMNREFALKSSFTDSPLIVSFSVIIVSGKIAEVFSTMASGSNLCISWDSFVSALTSILLIETIIGLFLLLQIVQSWGKTCLLLLFQHQLTLYFSGSAFISVF